MPKHDQLTVREIHGPYAQLLTNLQGENGREWLEALNKFNHRKNPWVEPVDEKVCREVADDLIKRMAAQGKQIDAVEAFASAIQCQFNGGLEHEGRRLSISIDLDFLMRGILEVLRSCRTTNRTKMDRKYVLDRVGKGYKFLKSRTIYE